MTSGCSNAGKVPMAGGPAGSGASVGPADLVVVGLGPAGVACLLQAVREGLRVVAIADQPVGGLLPAARRLDNLPGWPGGVGGVALARRMARQVVASGAPVIRGTVVSLRLLSDGGLEAVLADGRRVIAEVACLAPGTNPAPLPWAAAEGLAPARDARDIPADLSARRVLVIGGGDAAFDTALAASDRGAQAVVLVRGPEARAAAHLRREAAEAGVVVRHGTVVEGLDRQDGTWRVSIAGGEILSADHVVASIGRIPRDDLARAVAHGVGNPPKDEVGVSAVGLDASGAFVAGDVHRGHERFAAAAMGDGQEAAMKASKWLREAGRGRMR